MGKIGEKKDEPKCETNSEISPKRTELRRATFGSTHEFLFLRLPSSPSKAEKKSIYFSFLTETKVSYGGT